MNKFGGAESERHFRVVELDGKKVNIGGVSITNKGSPSDAARKLLTSVIHEKGLKNEKLDLGKVNLKFKNIPEVLKIKFMEHTLDISINILLLN